MRKKTLLSWSSGKDSTWALHVLRQDPNIDIVGLFCTVNKAFDRVAMHGVRVELLQQQAKAKIECFAFGDLFLEDVRKYREENLKDNCR